VIAIAIGVFFHVGDVAVADDFRGVVKTRSGAPLQYAKLTFCPNTGSKCITTYTGADGRFYLDARRGLYDLTVRSYMGTTFKKQSIEIRPNAGRQTIIVSRS
jgi:hypothetical protein